MYLYWLNIQYLFTFQTNCFRSFHKTIQKSHTQETSQLEGSWATSLFTVRRELITWQGAQMRTHPQLHCVLLLLPSDPPPQTRRRGHSAVGYHPEAREPFAPHLLAGALCTRGVALGPGIEQWTKHCSEITVMIILAVIYYLWCASHRATCFPWTIPFNSYTVLVRSVLRSPSFTDEEPEAYKG